MMKLGYIYIILAIAFIFTTTSCNRASKANNPNVIIVLTDDMGWGDLGFNGNQMVHTPVLDSLQKESVVLNKFYVSPSGKQTLKSLLTGQYKMHVDSIDIQNAIPKLFQNQGYSTACFGKWNLNTTGTQPVNFGFNYFFGYLAENLTDYFNAILDYNDTKVTTVGHISDVITDSLIAYTKNIDEPFFSMIAYPSVKSPQHISKECFVKNYNNGVDKKTAAVYSMCESIDNNVNKIINTLKACNKFDNTILLFLSDNGPGYVRFNGGLKGRKEQVDEGGVRVPFIINYPNGNFVNRKINYGFAAHIDVLPTLLKLANITDPQANVRNGVDISQVFLSHEAQLPDRIFYSYFNKNDRSVCGAVRTEKYLLTCYPFDTSLYDLTNDPFQMNNIIINNSVIADSLKQAYINWLNTLGIENERNYINNVTNGDLNYLKLNTLFRTEEGYKNQFLSINSTGESGITEIFNETYTITQNISKH